MFDNWLEFDKNTDLKHDIIPYWGVQRYLIHPTYHIYGYGDILIT